jgi:hypothetical protein
MHGDLLATLRESHLADGSSRIEFLEQFGRLLITVIVAGAGATEVLVGERCERPFAPNGSADGAARNAAVQQVGEGLILQSLEVEGRAVKVIDDYQRRTRHFVFACSPELFLHVNLDDEGTITLAERTVEHATLRVVRRDRAGRLLESTATVLPGEGLEALARRCDLPLADLIALNPVGSRGPIVAGALLRLA